MSNQRNDIIREQYIETLEGNYCEYLRYLDLERLQIIVDTNSFTHIEALKEIEKRKREERNSDVLDEYREENQ